MLVKTLQKLLLSVLKCEPWVSRYCNWQQDCTQYNSTAELRTDQRTRVGLGNRDMEGAPRDVLVTPLHCQDVVTPLLDHIRHVVLVVAQMLDGHLFTRDCRPVDAD